jgi:Linear amide C-N hydrolases, choloylglycine hydrolase family
MANSPTFDWHMTNLSNYINLSVLNVPPVQLSGLKLAQFGQGSGLHGLPGDYTSPSRFVRAAVFSQSAIPSDNTRDAVLQAFHILNAFDIPLGAVRASEDGGMIAEYTTWTSAADLKDLTWSFRTYPSGVSSSGRHWRLPMAGCERFRWIPISPFRTCRRHLSRPRGETAGDDRSGNRNQRRRMDKAGGSWCKL